MRKLVALFLLFVFPDMIPARNCSTVLCSHNSSIPIRFPFTLESNRRHDCGYPGFSIKCSRMGKTALELPRSGEFFLRDISYAKQQIWLYDPGNCLPGWLMKLNLSGSPFSAPHHLDFTFLSCPKNQTSESGIIDCLSNNTDVVLATYNKLWADLMVSLYCKIIGIVPVPTSRKIRPSRGFLVDLNKDIQLSWHDPDCKTCERKHGFCGFKSNTSQKIGCSNMKSVPVSRPMKEDDGFLVDLSDNNLQLSWGTPNCKACERTGGTCDFKNYTRQQVGCFNQKTGDRGRQIAKIVSLSVTLPALVCGIGIACCRCCRNSANSEGNESNSSEQIVLQPAAVTVGLSEKTIQSFTKLELGESRRIKGPNDIVCPICLSEYLPKEVLRCMPECNHCFHADCVDPWLRMNQKCPVCRNSPSSNA